MPIPGGTLDGEPQRIRLATHDNSVSIGADYSGKHGVPIVKGLQDAGNGMLLGIGEVIEPPSDLGRPRSFLIVLCHTHAPEKPRLYPNMLRFPTSEKS